VATKMNEYFEFIFENNVRLFVTLRNQHL